MEIVGSAMRWVAGACGLGFRTSVSVPPSSIKYQVASRFMDKERKQNNSFGHPDVRVVSRREVCWGGIAAARNSWLDPDR